MTRIPGTCEAAATQFKYPQGNRQPFEGVSQNDASKSVLSSPLLPNFAVLNETVGALDARFEEVARRLEVLEEKVSSSGGALEGELGKFDATKRCISVF